MEIFDGSFRQWRKRGQLELDMLFRALRELGVDPARFWVEVFGGDFDPVELAKRPTAPPRDPVVRRAVARWQGPPPRESTGMTEARWRRLDALRGEDPKLAVRRSTAALKHAEPRWIPRLLAAYGSARRAQARLDPALEALGDQQAPRIKAGMQWRGSETIFYVRDNGSGIDPRYHDKIFGLFERLETAEEGTGIGLALVRRIVEQHGGRVWVESEGVGRGSTFCFTLPQAASRGDVESEAGSEAEAAPSDSVVMAVDRFRRRSGGA